jgi:hypothetical protein
MRHDLKDGPAFPQAPSFSNITLKSRPDDFFRH